MASTDRLTIADASNVDQVLCIPRDRIRRFTGQPRTFFDTKEMNELADSIAEIGQKTPVIVRAVTGDPEHDYELVDGERRLIACGMACVKTVRAWVTTIDDEEDQFESSVVANCNRAEHTPIEYALAIDRMRKHRKMEGLSPGDQIRRICKIFGKSEPWVYSHLSLLRLHPDVQALMAPTIPEKERLPQLLGVFISSLHHDLQVGIARKAVDEKMSLNQARFYARQVADEAGVQIKTAKKPGGLPFRNWERLRSTVNVLNDSLDALLAPAAKDALKKRALADLAIMAATLEHCINRLKEVQAGLIETPAAPIKVEAPKPVPVPPPTPTAVVVDIKSPRRVEEPRQVAPAPPPPPVSRPTAPPPPPAPKPVPARAVDTPKEQPIEVSHKVMNALFYANNGQPYGQPSVILGRAHLREALPEIDDLDVAVSKALSAAKDHWRIEPVGSEANKKFTSLMHRFRHNYGNFKHFHESLEHARKQDESDDPVSLQYKK